MFGETESTEFLEGTRQTGGAARPIKRISARHTCRAICRWFARAGLTSGALPKGDIRADSADAPIYR
ncbi:hypothetical protein [Treponema endosymbiont of Eucomonympha sp.]|uniref:hypothetical protein n=1 Tax=Treponema endosymbiont of Eucomonympha sp. TaxID=1580831 RepID=UPI001396A331|nr:hypothetical protein [Treponema endosymbiont of Eucomonympha sp.]